MLLGPSPRVCALIQLGTHSGYVGGLTLFSLKYPGTLTAKRSILPFSNGGRRSVVLAYSVMELFVVRLKYRAEYGIVGIPYLATTVPYSPFLWDNLIL